MGTEGFEAARFSGSGLACRRGGRTVFAGLAFSLTNGEALVLRGPNGSGKSTLLRLMAGLAVANAGGLSWNGAPVTDDPEAHGARLRFVGHLDAVKPALTVTENLAFAAGLWGGADAGRIAAALAAFGMGSLAHLPARVLSAGQRHRLALARLLLVPAPLWLLDEPANALDDAAVSALQAVIARHRTAGGMVVIATHGAGPIANAAALDIAQFATTVPNDWSDAA
jgi:heme exporter protein A